MLQQDLDDRVRGKVMALWIMGFGGTVPIGGLLGGLISEQPGHHLGGMLGAAPPVAVGLTAYPPASSEREPAGRHGRLRRRRLSSTRDERRRQGHLVGAR